DPEGRFVAGQHLRREPALMRALAAFALLGLAALTGCAPGKSIVTVTLDGDAAAPIGPIARLTVTPSDGSGHKDTITVPVGASIPPAYSFSLRFDASVKTTIHLSILALDDAGMAIASAAGDVDVKPSATARLPLTLTALVPPPPGSTLAFTTQPMDALAKTTLAPVRVTVLDGSGAPVTITNVPITVALGNAAGATLSGTLTVNATAGVATFADLSVDKAGSGYTLVASAPGTSDGTSAPFAIKTTGWVPQNAGLTGGTINDLILDPKHPATLYAATGDNGVWKSIDGGTSWARASTGLPRRKAVDALAIDPVTTTTLYAGCADAGIYKSTDGGGSWVQSSTLTINAAPSAAIAVDPTHPTAVYAAANKAVVRTLDGGTTWASVATNATYGSGPRSIAIHPTTGEVWVAQFGDGLARSPYMSTTFTLADGAGANIIPGVHPYMKCVAFDPNNSAAMYASGDVAPTVYVSTDTGGNWTAAATAPAHAPVKMRGFVGAGGVVRMYGAIPEEGIVSTPVATNKWDYPSAGITGANAVAVDPNTQNLVYAATNAGVERTTDSFNFTGVNNGLVGHGAWTITVDPKNGSKLYVGKRDGLFRSTDGGQSWSPPTSAMPGSTNVYAIAVDFTDDKQLYLGTDNWGFSSADFGATWTAVTYGGTILPIFSLAATPSQSGTFFAGGGGGDAYSIASGATAWSPAGSGLPASSRINALVAHPTNAMILYAATSASGVYKTANAGAVWSASSTGLASMKIVGLALDPMTPATLYAATADQGVYKSSDAGATWSAASSGLQSMNTTAIALAPSQPATLYVATDKGVHQSLDGGATWAPYNAGLGASEVNALAVDPTDPLSAFAATWDGGVYKNITQ
ncbi:MAG: WD40/YVTN/BNR-like repeat-containing protein, partial [Polyangia bacterium]